jgi:ribonuclease P protein component
LSDFRLSTREKLKSEKELTRLFESGKSFTAYPIKVIYQITGETGNQSVQAAFTVSKRNFKRAVDRNRIKRLMREAYRLNKKNFLEKLKTSKSSARLILIFLDRKLPEFAQVHDKIIIILQRLSEDHEESSKRIPGAPDKRISEGN